MTHDTRPKHLDLFSGIAGFSIAFESCGFRTIAFVECDPIKCLVLRDQYPDVPILPDVRDTEGVRRFCAAFGTIDVITAGVPCQPASTLGKQLGTADERWMWPATIELVRAIRPRYFVAENPPAVITLERGRAWNGIVSGLVASGYDLQWDVFPAGAFGAGHRRERVILVATDADSISNRQCDIGRNGVERPAEDKQTRGAGSTEPNITDEQCLDNWLWWTGKNASNSKGKRKRIATNKTHAKPTGRKARHEPASDSGGDEISANSNRDGRTESRDNEQQLHQAAEGNREVNQPVDGNSIPSLIGRVRDFGNGFPWWHEVNTGIPVLATGLPSKLVEGATKCIGDSIVPQAVVPIARAIYKAINP